MADSNAASASGSRDERQHRLAAADERRHIRAVRLQHAIESLDRRLEVLPRELEIPERRVARIELRRALEHRQKSCLRTRESPLPGTIATRHHAPGANRPASDPAATRSGICSRDSEVSLRPAALRRGRSRQPQSSAAQTGLSPSPRLRRSAEALRGGESPSALIAHLPS